MSSRMWKPISGSKTTKSLEDLQLDYEDDKNSMLSIVEKDNNNFYEDFYEELDNRVVSEQSMNMIFFGPPLSFMRLDPETILHIIINTKSHLIPITRTLLAWDLITDGKTAAFLQGREYLAFSSLLNVIPEEDLYYVNFGDPSVMKFFSNHYVDLHFRKFGVLATAYRRYFGYDWYKNSSSINELGYLLCGFPASELKKIPPKVFKEINTDVFSKIAKCRPKQTQALYKVATHPYAYGEPIKWTSHEIVRLDALLSCIPPQDISSIRLEAIAAITPDVMKKIAQQKLEYFGKQQILRMNPKTRRIFILRIDLKNSLDMNRISTRGSTALKLQPFPYVLSTYVSLVSLIF